MVKSTPWDPSYRLRLAKARLAAGQDAGVSQDALASIASGASVPYELRIKAAAALSGRAHGELGSGELNLLAANSAPISPAAADKFYFYEARIKAAQNAADSQIKLQLLSHCVIDFPRRDEARIPLFEAAAGMHSDEFAIEILQPLLHTQFLGIANRTNANAEDAEIIGSDDVEEADSDDSIAPPTPSLKLSRAQQAQLAQLVGDTMARLSRLSEAVSYFGIARQSQTAPAVRKDLAHKISDLKAALRVQHQNAARQPLPHEALEQDRIVRPRLLAHATSVSKATTTKGGVKP